MCCCLLILYPTTLGLRDPMACDYKDFGGIKMVLCSRGQRPTKPKPCYKCGKPSTRLCDFRKIIVRDLPTVTCDRPMCDDCTTRDGVDTDYCQEHRQRRLIWDSAANGMDR